MANEKLSIGSGGLNQVLMEPLITTLDDATPPHSPLLEITSRDRVTEQKPLCSVVAFAI